MRIIHFAIYTFVYTLIVLLLTYLFGGTTINLASFVIFLLLGYAFSLWLEKR